MLRGILSSGERITLHALRSKRATREYRWSAFATSSSSISEVDDVCGIGGLTLMPPGPVKAEWLEGFLEDLAHRGPDDHALGNLRRA